MQSVVPLFLLCHTLLNDDLRDELDSHVSFDNKVIYEELKEIIYRDRFRGQWIFDTPPVFVYLEPFHRPFEL